MVKALLSNLTVLNGLLLALVALWVILIVLPFLQINIKAPAIRTTLTTPSSKGESTTVLNPSSSVDYTLISEQNLFHPERKIPPEKAEEKLVPRPEIVLFGTVITDHVSIAYFEDKKTLKTTPGRGRRQIAAEKGYNLNGYILREIKPDSVVFAKGDDRLIVRLEDGEKRRDTEMKNAPVAGGMLPGNLPSSAPTVPSPKAAHLAPSLPQTPVTAGTGEPPGTRPRSRQEMLLEVQRIKQERLKPTQ